jgi:predicted N-acetyltransferase YhbS
MQHQSIIGMYALLRNDLVSRQDLCPWLACLYVAPEYRGQRGAALLQHAEQEARRKGYDRLYLCSGLDGYYEQFGWSHFANGYAVNGAETKIYEASLAARTLPDPLPVIQSLQQCPERREAFIAYVTEAWPAVKNAVIRQLDGSEATGATELPLTFLMVKHDRIIGFYQLVEQEQLVRKDLSPWIAPLFVDERERGQSLGAELLRHARKTAGRLGYGKVYLTTDHIGYYEKYGFREIGLSSFEWGRPSKIYEHDTL